MKLSKRVEKKPFQQTDKNLSLDGGDVADRKESLMVTVRETLSKNMYNQNKHQDSDSSKPVTSQGTGTWTALLDSLSSTHEGKRRNISSPFSRP